MSQDNPYATPATDPTLSIPAGDELQLAKLGDRFVGSLIDGLIGVAVAIPLWGGLFLLGVIHSMAEMGLVAFQYKILIGVLHYAVFMAIQWKSLSATGQSIGKRVANTRIVTMDGRKPDAKDIVLKRYGFVTLISMIPFVGVILTWVDILMIFKTDRRCLHDLIAGTRVVIFPPGTVIG